MVGDKKISVRCFVAGRVQGVWFRANAKKEADKLGCTGWARNLSDGRVEIFACGDERQIEKLKTWLRKGPPLARVDEFLCEEVALEELVDFQIIE